MNKTIVYFTLKQLLRRPIRLALVVGFFIFPLIVDCFMVFSPFAKEIPRLVSTENASYFALILAAGIIGCDSSEGILPLLFSRPIKRSQYLLSKWLTISCVVSVLAVANDIAHWLLLTKGSLADFYYVDFSYLPQEVSISFGVTSVVLILSALLPAVADVFIYILILLFASIPFILSICWNEPAYANYSIEALSVISPSINFPSLVSIQDIFFASSLYAFKVTTSLLIAIYFLNSKELSYGKE